MALRTPGLRPIEPHATVLLSYRYFVPGEPKARSLDRLRRQLEWLRSAYRPISIPQLLKGLEQGTVPDRSIVVTTDDAKFDIYEVSEEFRNFGVPLAIFVCVGWVTLHDFSENDTLIRAVDALEWYRGPDTRIRFGNRYICDLSASKKAMNVDWILNERQSLLPHLEELCTKISALGDSRHSKHTICNWSELQELASSGSYIGAHSISHIPISQMSAVRRNFEINESKRVIEAKFGSCTSFAYPYGMRVTHNSSIQTELRSAGFQAAFLNHSDVVIESSPKFELPRIAIPDAPMPLTEFKTRVQGGGIPFQRLKGHFWPT